MNDFFVRNRLSEYIDGTLSAQDNEAISQALAQNATLQQEYLELKEAVDLLKDYGQVAPSQNLAPSIMELLEEEKPSNVILLKIRAYAPQISVAATIILIVTAFLLPEKETKNTLSATIVHTPPKSKSIQLPQNLSNTLFEKSIDVTKIAIADEEDRKAEKKPISAKRSKTKRTRTASQRIKPLVLDQPQSREDSPYLLFMTDPDILFKIDALAKANNSKITQRDGSALTPYAMNDGKSTQVLKLTTDAQNINAIEEKLRQLGTEFHQFSTATENQTIRIELNIQFE